MEKVGVVMDGPMVSPPPASWWTGMRCWVWSRGAGALQGEAEISVGGGGTSGTTPIHFCPSSVHGH